ncbi:EamA family transporter [Halosimplex halophilum]|uniref:EamA family transporter n=1 Tax=Halosimplex halophilum TaxID=2559572 RepID=UPI00107F01AA|nr:EamA family transporter [Halosimplex halophilum]
MVSEFVVGVGFALLSALAFAAQGIAVRLGTKTRSIAAVVGAVFAVNLLVVVPAAALAASPDFGLTARAVAAFAVAGLLGSLLARVCYYVGIERLGASRAEPLRALAPLFALGAAVAFLGEFVTAARLGGVALLVGAGALVGLDSRAAPGTATGRALWIGVAFPVAAALFLGIDPVFTKLGLADGTTPLVGVAVRIVAAATAFGLYLLWRALRGGRVPALGALRAGRRPSLGAERWLLAASVANTVYLLAYYEALARVPVSVATPVLSASTLFVVAGAAVFLRGDERVTPRLVGAALLVVVGVTLVVRG